MIVFPLVRGERVSMTPIHASCVPNGFCGWNGPSRLTQRLDQQRIGVRKTWVAEETPGLPRGSLWDAARVGGVLQFILSSRFVAIWGVWTIRMKCRGESRHLLLHGVDRSGCARQITGAAEGFDTSDSLRGGVLGEIEGRALEPVGLFLQRPARRLPLALWISGKSFIPSLKK